MRINHAPLWLALLLITVGGASFGVGILTGAHVLTGIGMIMLPVGMLYGLLAGYPTHEAPRP
jgi:hypothetical protein